MRSPIRFHPTRWRPSVARRRSEENDAQRLVRYVKERRHVDALHLLLSHSTNHRGGGSSSPLPSPTSQIATTTAPSPLQAVLQSARHMVKEDSFLRYVLRHQPTADLVSFLASHTGEGGGGENSDHSRVRGPPSQTLLHTAVANGCSRSVLESIVVDHDGGYQARVADELGRYPLHWACVNPMHVKKQVIRAVVGLLLDLYPEAQGIPDGSGRTPLDLAREHCPSRCFLRLLNGEGEDNESHSSSSSFAFLKRSVLSPRSPLSKAKAPPPRRALTPLTFPDTDRASDEVTVNDDHPSNNRATPDYRQLYQVHAYEDCADDDISSLGCDEEPNT